MKYEIVRQFPDAALCERWNTFPADAEMVSHYTTPHFFKDAFAGDGERFAVLASEEEKIVAVLTGIREGNEIKSGLAVRPQTAFLKGCDRAAAGSALTDGLREISRGKGVLVSFFTWHPLSDLSRAGYTSEECAGQDRVVMLDLSKSSVELFKGFNERRRSTLRKTMRDQKLDVKVLETDAELAELYEIHKDWNARKGYVPMSLEQFRAGAEQTEHRRIYIASHEGKIVAGTFFRFCRAGVVEFAANHSYQEFQRLHPNELIMWRAIEWACGEGFSHFSLGGSHPFLTKFGGELVGAYRYRLDTTFLKRHDARERLTRLAVKTYRGLPTSIRDRIKSAAV